MISDLPRGRIPRPAQRLFAVVLAAALSTASIALAVELYFRRHPTTAASTRTLQTDPLLGWDSVPRMVPLDNSGRTSVVYFIGDSFTQDRRWPLIAQRRAAQSGVEFDGYTLGVSGFGTTQEWLKIERDFDLHHPQLVVVQLFAWNDLRDNWCYPWIAYSPETTRRPYLVPQSSGYRLVPAAGDSWLTRRLAATELWQRFLFRARLRLDDEAAKLAVDWIADERLALPVHYTEPSTWEPFYQRDAYDRPFVRGAMAVTREAFRRLAAFLAARGARLIVVGLDNPFTVDDDVATAWIRPGVPFDPDLPLQQIAGRLHEDGVPFESARPALLEVRRRTGRKVYNPPAGDLSGHLEPAGEESFGEVAARMIVGLGALER